MCDCVTKKPHLDHIGFVSLQDLNGLSCIWVNDEDTGVTALSDQTLPSPEQREKEDEKSTRVNLTMWKVNALIHLQNN